MPRSSSFFAVAMLALVAGIAYAQAPKGALVVYQAISTPDFGYLPTSLIIFHLRSQSGLSCP